MRTRLLALPLLALLSTPATAQRLTRVQPDRLVQVPATETVSVRMVTLRGVDITPIGERDALSDRVRIQARRGGGAWRTLRSTGWADGQVSALLRGRDWYATPGTVEMRLVVNGRPTNPVAIRVVPAPRTPPEIVKLDPSHLRAGQRDTEAYLFWVEGRGYSEPLTVTVGGRRAHVERMDVEAGEVQVLVPHELRGRPGRYAVVVTTRAGSSPARYVQVALPAGAGTRRP